MTDTTIPSPVSDFWENFGDSSSYTEIETEGTTGSLAEDVLKSFNIETASTQTGGNLSNLDIKHMDALSVINLSLLEETMNDEIVYEAIVNNEGEVEFIAIGKGSSSLSDIYYQIQTETYVEPCVGVMITGGKPMPERRPMTWKPIWDNAEEGEEKFKAVYDTSKMVSNCSLPGYSIHATIIFGDPHLESKYKDGISNLYEITEPFENIIGYAKFIHAPGKTADTKITFNKDSAKIPLMVGEYGANGPDMGTLIKRPPPVDPTLANEYGSVCWTSTGAAAGGESTGVPINIPENLRFEAIWNTKVDKFVQVEQVLIVGYELDYVTSGPKDASIGASGVATDENSIVSVMQNNTVKKVFKLEEGRHYTIVYGDSDDGETKKPYIQFAQDTKHKEPKLYGSNTEFMYHPYCELGEEFGGQTFVRTLFPCAENKGYLVDEIWAIINISSPSITVTDPEFNPDGEDVTSKAKDIADNLMFWVAPIILYEPPPAIAFNGALIDQSQGIADKDPTTKQDFENTDLENALDSMDSGAGLNLSLSFITDEDKLKKLSSGLHSFMNENEGVATTYVCGPNAEPKLGAPGLSGGVINSISYSYSDSSSYTISVEEGPHYIGGLGSGGSGGPTFKATEAINCRGTIIQDLGNHIYFKVRLDGFGDRIAINTAPTILRVGDIVSCSVHNNPIEV